MSHAFGPLSWWLAVLGWSAIVALWHTSVVAIAFAAWRLWRHDATARRHYVAGAAALVVATGLTLATPVLLVIGGRTAGAAPMRSEPIVSTAGPAMGAVEYVPANPPGTSRRASWRAVVGDVVPVAAPWIGAVWCVGFAVGVARLGVGLSGGFWIRRRATPTRSPEVVAAARAAAASLGTPPVRVLSSAHVEAPVVIGVISPALLLPLDLERRLDADALHPLLEHELAHVDRRDYAANLLQSAADTLMFFSPGARWLSRSVREAREYCCDDLVAARCGAGAYAKALTMLAGLGVSARARPAVHAAGPRLIVRIRRLLEEDTMIPFVGLRLAGYGIGLALLTVGGGSLVPLSAAGAAGAAASPAAAGTDGPVPNAWVREQAGAAVELRAVTSTEAGTCGTATVENRADMPVTALRFVGVAHYSRMHPSEALDGSLETTELLSVSVPPGGTATIALNLLPATALRSRFTAGRFQAMCAIQTIRYANGVEWTSPPAVIFARRWPEVSRGFLNRDSSGSPQFCRDESGATYSLGALIGVAREPGRRARCEDGRWVEQEPAASSGGPVVWMDVVLPDGHQPALKVEPNRMARLSVGTQAWGFTPTIDPGDGRQVRIAVFDLNMSPPARVADLSIGVGDVPVEIAAVGLKLGVRSIRTP